MAAPTYSINGGTELPGVVANWERVVKRYTPDGVVYQDYALHTWEIPQAEMSNFAALNLQQGQRLTGLATVSLADCQVGATYTSAEIVEMVNCQQVGLRATGIRIIFRVDVT